MNRVRSLFLKSGRNFGYVSYAGFTLLEILIAITIFSVIVTTIYSSLRAVLSKNDAIKYGSDIHERARSCLNRIIGDLSSIYVELPPLYKQPQFNAPPDMYRFVGGKKTVGTKYYPKLRFTSMAHLPINGSGLNGIAEIVYYVMDNDDPDKPPVLKRSDRVYPFFQEDEFQERESDPTLCEDVDELVFTYYDENGEEHEDWDSESSSFYNTTPKMIGIQMKIKKDTESHAFEIKVELPVYRKKVK